MNRFLLFIVFNIFYLNAYSQTDTVLLRVCYTPGTSTFTNRIFLIYDSTNAVNTTYSEIWDHSMWTPYSRNYNYYDSNGDTISEIYSYWLNNWNIQSGFYYIIDTTHHEIFNFSLNSNLDTTLQSINVFNSAGIIIADTAFSSSHVPNSRNEYYYSSNNKLDSVASFNYDSTNWDTAKYKKYYRNILDQDSIWVQMNYNHTTGLYDSSLISFHNYDTINHSDTIIDYDFFSNYWNFDNIYFENYDSYGRLFYYYSHCYSCGYTSDTYHYLGTSDSLTSEVQCQVNHGGSGGCDSCVYYYLSFSTNIKSIEQSTLKIFPNPASDLLNINMGNATGIISINIYNLLGVKIYSTKINSEKNIISTINISSIPSGMYLISIKQNENTFQKSFRISR